VTDDVKLVLLIEFPVSFGICVIRFKFLSFCPGFKSMDTGALLAPTYQTLEPPIPVPILTLKKESSGFFAALMFPAPLISVSARPLSECPFMFALIASYRNDAPPCHFTPCSLSSSLFFSPTSPSSDPSSL